jgi:hypothetical protein
MKIAIIHDHLTCRAGGEQVALTFHKAFPNAPIYTLAYNSEGTFPDLRRSKGQGFHRPRCEDRR